MTQARSVMRLEAGGVTPEGVVAARSSERRLPASLRARRQRGQHARLVPKGSGVIWQAQRATLAETVIYKAERCRRNRASRRSPPPRLRRTGATA
jgi:hypothetical protein